MMRDSSKPVLLSTGEQVHSAHTDKNKVSIYSTAGLLLQTIRVTCSFSLSRVDPHTRALLLILRFAPFHLPAWNSGT